MDRKEFFTASAKGTLGCCALALFGESAPAQTAPSEADREKEFVKNWMSDLFDAIDEQLDEAAKVKLLGACGRGCYRRHSFKQDIALAGKGDVAKLVEAYKKNFEVWREEQTVHIRYGATNKQCYCPAARYHPAKPHDVHCECTRATHQTIFETALGRPIRVEVVESLRRGNVTCHFVAHVG